VSHADVPAAPAMPRRPWRRALAWLLFLWPFFYMTYGAANFLASQRQSVPSVVFAWEHRVPFLAWTIVPYWTINAFYAASLFVCATRDELDRHGRRLLTAQVVAVAFFIVTPLKFTLAQPATSGLSGFLFTALASFDKPFNQAPSLHIALLVVLWPLYARHVPRLAQWPLHLWFTVVGVSVLTTYQHHFFDIPTGVLLGALCLWVWPDQARSPVTIASITNDRRRLALASRYAGGSAAAIAAGIWLGGAALWLLWPTVSLGLVAVNYGMIGPEGFQKRADGTMSLAAWLLLAPYLIAAFVNSRLWTRGEAAAVAVADPAWLGRIPAGQAPTMFTSVVDVCAELPRTGSSPSWTAVPMLDLAVPGAVTLREAAACIERQCRRGPVLVCCALGYSRSAAAVAVWLMTSGRAATADAAIDAIRRVRPRVVINPGLREAIVAAAEPGA